MCYHCCVCSAPKRVRHMVGKQMYLLKEGTCVKDGIIEFTLCLLAREVAPDGQTVGSSASGF